MFLVPAVIQFTPIAVPDDRSRKLSTLKRIFYGASPISRTSAAEAEGVCWARAAQLYGLTETVGGGPSSRPRGHDPARAGGCARAGGLSVRGPGGGLARAGRCRSAGRRILIKSPCVAKGLLEQARRDRQGVVGGWFYGDAGYFDADGYLYPDRVGTLDRLGRENVYPAEVENALMSHPAIADAAVVRRADDKWGEGGQGHRGAEPGVGGERRGYHRLLRTHRQLQRPSIPDFIAAPAAIASKILRRELRDPIGQAGRGR